MTPPAPYQPGVFLFGGVINRMDAEHKRVSKLVWAWQKRLRLNDWRIAVKVCPKHEMPENVLGNIEPAVARKEAYIKILREKDKDPDAVWTVDQEVTVVHELIHLHFEPFWNEKRADEMEQAIELLAQAMVEANRRPTS